MQGLTFKAPVLEARFGEVDLDTAAIVGHRREHLFLHLPEATKQANPHACALAQPR